MLVTEGTAYALKLDLAAVDLWQVEHADDASVGMGSQARELLLTIALAERRGKAFEEFSSRPWAKTERAWIAALRAGAVEYLAETRLQLGPPEAAVTLRGAHIGEHPWREAGWTLLALARYSSSRQADALGVISQARSTLMQDLGLEPSYRLTELENGIMRHYPSLNLACDGGSILSRAVTASASTGAGAAARHHRQGVTWLREPARGGRSG